MRPVGDLLLLDDARSPLERMGQAQQPLEQRRVGSALLEFQNPLGELIDQFAPFEAEISVRILRHALGGHMRLNDPQQVPRHARELRHRLQGLSRAGLGLLGRLCDVGDRDVDLFDSGALLLGREFDLTRRLGRRRDESENLLEGGRHLAELF